MNYLRTNRKLVGIIGTVIATVIAIIYLIVLPEKVTSTTGITQFILRYAHSICWVLLAGFSLLYAFNRFPKFRNILAYMALASYAVFMLTMLLAQWE